MAETPLIIVVKQAVRSVSQVLCDKLLEMCIEEFRKKEREIWVRDWMNKKSLGASDTIIRELYSNDPQEYTAVMRLTTDQFDELLCMISPIITRNDTLMCKALPPRLKLEIKLTYLSSGTNSRILSIMYRASKAAISKLIPEVCDSIYYVLKEYIKVPDKTKWEEIQVGFNDRWHFPGCCGAIDGKHVVIKAPPSAGSEYYNYKGTNSIVLLGVVDHDYKFTYITVGAYGRNADGGVFQSSDLYPLLENDSILPKGGVLVGDDAFPLKTYLMKPYSTPNLTKEERVYNYRTSRARRIVENGFGILTSRFRVFCQPVAVKVETTIKMVKCASAIHNWLRFQSDVTYTPPGSFDYEDIVNATVLQGQWRSEISELPSIQRTRQHNRPQKIAEQLRETYKEYFSGEWSVEWQDRVIQ